MLRTFRSDTSIQPLKAKRSQTLKVLGALPKWQVQSTAGGLKESVKSGRFTLICTPGGVSLDKAAIIERLTAIENGEIEGGCAHPKIRGIPDAEIKAVLDLVVPYTQPSTNSARLRRAGRKPDRHSNATPHSRQIKSTASGSHGSTVAHPLPSRTPVVTPTSSPNPIGDEHDSDTIVVAHPSTVKSTPTVPAIVAKPRKSSARSSVAHTTNPALLQRTTAHVSPYAPSRPPSSPRPGLDDGSESAEYVAGRLSEPVSRQKFSETLLRHGLTLSSSSWQA